MVILLYYTLFFKNLKLKYMICIVYSTLTMESKSIDTNLQDKFKSTYCELIY